jgi:hypothetical protein
MYTIRRFYPWPQPTQDYAESQSFKRFGGLWNGPLIEVGIGMMRHSPLVGSYCLKVEHTRGLPDAVCRRSVDTHQGELPAGVSQEVFIFSKRRSQSDRVIPPGSQDRQSQDYAALRGF